jgi:predicted Zn-dependent protease with MMP-like domain
MVQVDDEHFRKLVVEAIDGIPEKYQEHLKNVVFIVEDEPNQQQRANLQPGTTLLGLYEGVPLPQRQGTTKLLPDKITLFKKTLEFASQDLADLNERIKNTIWHEVAHYFGLDHGRINELENK